MNTIPSLNLQDFVSGNSAQQHQFIVALGRAFEGIGFVAISGHYLSEALIDELYAQIKAFFDLPEDIKKKYEIEGLGGQRGYTSFGKEYAKGKKEADLTEFWHFGQYAEVPAILKPHYPAGPDNPAQASISQRMPRCSRSAADAVPRRRDAPGFFADGDSVSAHQL